jgi:hypothetical protein
MSKTRKPGAISYIVKREAMSNENVIHFWQHDKTAMPCSADSIVSDNYFMLQKLITASSFHLFLLIIIYYRNMASRLSSL